MRLFAAAIAFLMVLSTSVEASETKIKLHRHTAGHLAWATNAYFVETATGVVLIDAQLLMSDAKTLAAMIKSTGKPLEGVILTHPHLDHFGGLPVLQEELGEFPIYAVKDTADNMEKVHGQMLGFYKMPNSFGEALDSRLVKATDTITDGQTITLAGLDFLIHDLGPSDSESNILIYQKDLDVLFAGDSFYPFAHYYIGEGHIDGAKKHVNFIMENYGGKTAILGGHSNAASASQGADQLAYINFIEEATRKAVSNSANIAENGFLTREARGKVVADIMARYAHYDSFFIGAEQILPGFVFGAEQYLKRMTQEGR